MDAWPQTCLWPVRQSDRRRAARPLPQGRGTGWKDGEVIVSLMVVCAVLASLAFGVLVAYGVCLAFFRLFGARAATGAARLDRKPVEAKV